MDDADSQACGVVRISGEGYAVGQPKSAGGIRDMAVPPHLIAMIKSHLKNHVGPGLEPLILTSPTAAGVLRSLVDYARGLAAGGVQAWPG